ncbi:TetR family transcriptional regulator [Streptomyces tateyamensis]|uniref:TetR family transcriptional regulator n=1 Tax=Streptomyces tateyamensis TaxID=565073 RepID=A0A2V4N4F0_9ACTN|nr:TetR/AcrR family transcriptional regulator [Streptomyces tateyamensis]PYC77722.1 TetR family transcriptional regulator [Streptomyces tateyamensis]
MAANPPLTGGALTQARILDAAARLMSSIGITRTTTKEIAREAGCSEATLYKHFRDKEEIFVRVLHERLPPFAEMLAELPAQAGSSTVAAHLTEVARAAVPFYRRAFPMAGAVAASADLLAAHRAKLDLAVAGPHMPSAHLAEYLRAEQALGRISAAVDPAALAMLLIGACFHRAFLTLFFDGGEELAGAEQVRAAVRVEQDEQFVLATVRALLEPVAQG